MDRKKKEIDKRRQIREKKNEDGKKKEKIEENCLLICIYWDIHKHFITGVMLYINYLDKNQIMDGTQWAYCERRWWKSHPER